MWEGLDPAAQVIIAAALGFEHDVRQQQPADLELVAMADLVAGALAGSLVGVSGEPDLSVRDDETMERWLADALVEDFTDVSDAYELLICDGRILLVADGAIGASSIVLMIRRGVDWSVAVWPSQHDRTYVPPAAPGGPTGVREPLVPIVPTGHADTSITPPEPADSGSGD